MCWSIIAESDDKSADFSNFLMSQEQFGFPHKKPRYSIRDDMLENQRSEMSFKRNEAQRNVSFPTCLTSDKVCMLNSVSDNGNKGSFSTVVPTSTSGVLHDEFFTANSMMDITYNRAAFSTGHQGMQVGSHKSKGMTLMDIESILVSKEDRNMSPNIGQEFSKNTVRDAGNDQEFEDIVRLLGADSNFRPPVSNIDSTNGSPVDIISQFSVSGASSEEESSCSDTEWRSDGFASNLQPFKINWQGLGPDISAPAKLTSVNFHGDNSFDAIILRELYDGLPSTMSGLNTTRPCPSRGIWAHPRVRTGEVASYLTELRRRTECPTPDYFLGVIAETVGESR